VSPVVLVATECDGKINFAPQGQYGTVIAKPEVIYISVIKEHLTAQNILKTKNFSINIPDEIVIEKIKQCGSVSGREEDKSKIFKTFYSKTRVPMIEECKVNYVCEVVRELEIEYCYMFFGEIKETYVNKNCITGELPDITKIEPLLCTIDGKLWTINNKVVEYGHTSPNRSVCFAAKAARAPFA
jgi:flavin reductase (DIM6/NTAB) family NADH-FMN oxidoreductase RutF